MARRFGLSAFPLGNHTETWYKRKGVVGGMTDRRASSIRLNHDWGATCQLEGSTDRKFELKMKLTFLASSLKEVEFTP